MEETPRSLSPSAQIPGAQVIARAAAVLTELGREAGAPKRAAHVARSLGLTEPTVSRILAALATAGLVERAESGGPWRLGPETDALAASRSRFSTRFWAEVEGSLLRTVETFGVAASFWLISGQVRVCVRRMDGATAPRWVGDHVGDRLGLWEGAGGIAWLAEPDLDDEEPARLTALAEARKRLSAEDFSGLARLISTARDRGAACDGTRSAHGYAASAVTVHGSDVDGTIGTLVLTQSADTLDAQRSSRIFAHLREEAARLRYALVRPYEASLR